jgi:hypothetical protein
VYAGSTNRFQFALASTTHVFLDSHSGAAFPVSKVAMNLPPQKKRRKTWKLICCIAAIVMFLCLSGVVPMNLKLGHTRFVTKARLSVGSRTDFTNSGVFCPLFEPNAVVFGFQIGNVLISYSGFILNDDADEL